MKPKMFRQIYAVCVCMVMSVSATRFRNCWPFGHLLQQGPLDYCLTKESPPQQILLGETIETGDCFRCVCTSDGLYCCGFGIHEYTGSIEVPDGCQLVVRGCNYSFVNMDNKLIPCS